MEKLSEHVCVANAVERELKDDQKWAEGMAFVHSQDRRNYFYGRLREGMTSDEMKELIVDEMSTDIDVAYFLLARIKSDDLKLDMEGLALEMASVGYHVKTKELDVTPIYMENGMVCVTGVAAEPKGAIEAEVKAEAKTEAKTELQPNLYTKVGLVRTWEKAHPGHGQYVGWCLTRGERGVVPPWKSFFKQFQEFALQLVGEEMKELDLSWTRNSTPPTWLKRGAQGLLFVKAATNPSHLILRRFQRLFHVAFV